MLKAILVGPCSEPKSRKIEFSTDTLVIFIDAGLKHKKTVFKKAINWLSIGDQDSGPYKTQIKLKKNKNESDLYHALKLLPKNVSLVEIYGLFPEQESRFDHRLFNLGEIFRVSEKYSQMFLLNDHEILLPAGKHSLDFKGEFSIVTFTKSKLKLTGQAKYPLKKKTVIDKFSSRTLSNVGLGEMTLETDKPVLLINVN